MSMAQYPTQCTTHVWDHQGLTFAGLDALEPCMIKPAISTVLEPRTAASATTEFAGFLHVAALGAHLRTQHGCTRRRLGRFCGSRGLNNIR